MPNSAAKPQVTRGEAAFAHRLPGGSLVCDLCPRFCELAPGQRGWCQTRFNKGGRLWAANYNWLSILQPAGLDTIPLVNFNNNFNNNYNKESRAGAASGALVLKLGSFGCNFQPQAERDSIGARFGTGRSFQPRDVAKLCLDLAPRGCIGAAFTFAEPLLWYEFLLQSAMLLKHCDLKVILATVGFVNPRPLMELIPYIDAVRFDLFAFDPLFYRSRLRLSFDEVLRSLKLLANSPIHLEVATPLLSGQNDDPAAIGNLAAYLAQNCGPDQTYHLLLPPEPLDRAQREQFMRCADAASTHLKGVYLSNGGGRS